MLRPRGVWTNENCCQFAFTILLEVLSLFQATGLCRKIAREKPLCYRKKEIQVVKSNWWSDITHNSLQRLQDLLAYVKLRKQCKSVIL